jgi:tetratricopeptide (TPR) repeat protein
MNDFFQKGLSTVNPSGFAFRTSCQLLTCLFFIVLLFPTIAFPQSDPHHDSLETAIRHAEEGHHKADLMLESLIYRYEILDLLHDETFLEELFLIYRYSKKIGYLKGMAETAKRIGYSFSNQTDSSRLYLGEALKLYINLNDSLYIAATYGDMSRTEALAGHRDLAIQYEKKHMNIISSMNDAQKLLDAIEGAAENFKMIGLFAEEEECYEKMIALEDSLKINSSRTLIKLARYHINHGNYREGIRYSLMADSAMEGLEDKFVPEYHDRDFMQAKMKGDVARAYRLWGYYDSALVWHRRAVAGMEAAPEHAGVDIPNQWEGIGYVYTQKGIYDSARVYLEKSAKERDKASDFLGVGESYDGLGYLCWLLGDEAGAVKYYADAIEMKSRFEKPVAYYRQVTFIESQSVSFLQLGKVYASWGMLESAMLNLEKSLVLCREIGYRKGEAETLIEFGKIKGSEGDQPGAEKDLKDALRIFTEIDYKPGQADAISSLGDLFFAKGDFEPSLEYYKQAEYILQQTQNPIMLTDAWTNIGLTLAGMKNYTKAEGYLLKALDQSEKYNLLRRNMKINKALADICSKLGKEDQALDYIADFLLKRDSINLQKTYFLLADLQSRNEAEMKERQLELLGKENQVKELTLARSNGMLMGIFGIIMLLVLLSITIIRTLRLKESHREALLQQRLFRARMSPGFINHSLGKVKNLVMETKSSQASDYITYFSRMMQHMLEGSRRELIVFSKGLSMLRSYFELNKLGQDGSFGYEIIVDPQIDQEETMVPSFLEEVITPVYKAETGQRFVKIVFTAKERKIGICVESRGSIASLPGLSGQDLKSLMMIRSRLSEMGKKYKVLLDFNISDLKDHDGIVEGKSIDFDMPAIYD